MMNICELRLAPGNTPRYLALGPDHVLVLTVQPDDLLVCAHCPNLHIRMLEHATPSELRAAAEGLLAMAAVLESRA